jgi:hypothetical protein
LTPKIAPPIVNNKKDIKWLRARNGALRAGRQVRALREAAGTGDESIFDRMRLRYGFDMVTKNTISSIDKTTNLVYILKADEMTRERIACARVSSEMVVQAEDAGDHIRGLGMSAE